MSWQEEYIDYMQSLADERYCEEDEYRDHQRDVGDARICEDDSVVYFPDFSWVSDGSCVKDSSHKMLSRLRLRLIKSKVIGMTTQNEYDVSIHCRFDASDHEDAVQQMIAWLHGDNGALTGGYRSRKLDHETYEVVESVFIDAERLVY